MCSQDRLLDGHTKPIRLIQCGLNHLEAYTTLPNACHVTLGPTQALLPVLRPSCQALLPVLQQLAALNVPIDGSVGHQISEVTRTLTLTLLSESALLSAHAGPAYLSHSSHPHVRGRVLHAWRKPCQLMSPRVPSPQRSSPCAGTAGDCKTASRHWQCGHHWHCEQLQTNEAGI